MDLIYKKKQQQKKAKTKKRQLALYEDSLLKRQKNSDTEREREREIQRGGEGKSEGREGERADGRTILIVILWKTNACTENLIPDLLGRRTVLRHRVLFYCVTDRKGRKHFKTRNIDRTASFVRHLLLNTL